MHINQCMKYQCMKGEDMHDEEYVISLFREISNRLSLKMNKIYEPYGLTAVQFVILVELSMEDHQKVSVLAQKLNMSNSNLSAILQRLEKHNFVIRKRDDMDQRSVNVSLSNNAQGMMQQMKETTCMEQQLFAHISQEDRDDILLGLEKLNRVLKECDS